MSPWLREVAELVHAGHREEAIAIVRSLAESGNIAAQVRLARFGSEAGLGREDADAVVAKAEAAGVVANAEVHWSLFGAYEAGLGDCAYDEKARRALRHLEAYTELSHDAQAAYSVAVRYANGTIGTPADPDKARSWMARAAKLGSADAKRALTLSGGDA